MSLALSTRRDLYWREIHKFFDALSVEQFHQATLLAHNLALRYSDDGQLHSILRRRQDYPFLDQHFWLLDDWSVQNAELEKHLMLAMVFRFMAWDLNADIADPLSNVDHAFSPLAAKLQTQADHHSQQIFPASSPFWTYYDQTRESIQSPAFFSDLLPASGHWALPSLSLTAAAISAEKPIHLPRLLETTDHLRLVYQTVAQLASLRVDLRDGRISYPIQRAMQASGADDIKKLSADSIFGVLILSGTLEKICEENLARVEAARTLARDLNLPSFARFCEHTVSLLLQIRSQFGLKKQAAAESAGVEPSRNEPLRAFFSPAVDVIPCVIQKAEGYLLSDPTFREAWEVQQNTFKDFPLVIGQAFPSALILEVLGLHGHDISMQVDAVFEIFQEGEFHYYDIPETSVPDIDAVAFALRMHKYASQPMQYTQVLQRALRWVRENQMSSGQIPVWLWQNDSKFQISPLSVLYGENCATVEANLMIGLIDFDYDGYQDVITACAASWCERWLTVGLGVTAHYTPLFSLWTSLELISKLLKRPIRPALRDDLNRLATQVVERLKSEAVQPNLTPQSASYLTLACLRLPEFPLPFDSAWITRLIKNQQWDGKWLGENIYVTPSGRGLGTVWFASHTITTAFCYHALKTYQTHFEAR
ncbi:MAG: hypothetical protein HYZ22_10150 [Chloroflexi bacterium]|nr:hypothetical protein [Chloroflexota bacterium]